MWGLCQVSVAAGCDVVFGQFERLKVFKMLAVRDGVGRVIVQLTLCEVEHMQDLQAIVEGVGFVPGERCRWV